ncbi:2-acylglycerophosphoethanolamine acyltransferase [Legionella feeleii]|nr:2-acylglycerophosphoethanolamine acyltransferase [Legionella feeleii]
MIVGAFALYYQTVFLMMIVLTGMGIHSSFFGPLKYAILPDLLPRPLLLNATALIESSTFLAILLGTTFGALVIGSTDAHISYAIVLTNIIAILGLLSSLLIPNTPPKIETLKVDWRVWHATRLMLKETMLNKKVLPTIFTISWFWLLGAVVLTKLPDYMHYVLNADTTVFAVFLALFSIGIAFGSIAIGYFLGGKITLKYVPLAMLLLSAFAIDLYFASPKVTSTLPLQELSVFFTQINNIRVTIDFFLFSFCGGLFIVPLYTFLQVASEDDMRARVIASNNIFNALFMVLGSLLVMFLLYLQLGITVIFLILAILNAIVAIGLWLLLRNYFKN